MWAACSTLMAEPLELSYHREAGTLAENGSNPSSTHGLRKDSGLSPLPITGDVTAASRVGMEELIHEKLTGALRVQDRRRRCCSQLQLPMRHKPKELSDFPKVTR